MVAVFIISVLILVVLPLFAMFFLASPMRSAELVWSQPHRTFLDNMKLAALPDGNLAVTVNDSTLEILDPTGNTLSNSVLPEGRRVWNILSTDSGGIYIGTVPAGVTAYSSHGEELWSYVCESGDYTRLHPGPDGLIYGVSWTGMPPKPPTWITILEPGGGLVAEFYVPVVPEHFNGVAIDPGGTVYLVADQVDTNIYAYSPVGELQWSRTLHTHPDRGNRAFPAGRVTGVVAGREVVAVSMRGVGVEVLSPEGSPLWQYQSPRMNQAPHPLHYGLGRADGLVIASYQGDVHGFDLAGNQVWRKRVPGYVTEITWHAGRIFIEVHNSSTFRYNVAAKVQRFDQELAADIKSDRMVFAVTPQGETSNCWLLPTGALLRTLPDEDGMAFGTYHIGSGSTNRNLLRLNLPR